MEPSAIGFQSSTGQADCRVRGAMLELVGASNAQSDSEPLSRRKILSFLPPALGP